MKRREFLTTTSLGGTAALLGVHPTPAAAESPPETTRIRLVNITRGICTAPQFVAEELLRAEGFADVQYVGRTDVSPVLEIRRAIASGEADISMTFAAVCITGLDEGEPAVILAGVHPGCFELIGTNRVRTIRDLKGKTVALAGLGTGSTQHIFLAVMLAYVGLDPAKDVRWVTHPFDESMQLLAEGKVDAFLGFPPEPQILRARKIGRVVVNSAIDRPWSQYFCCVIVANREFVRRQPVAAKRAVRAILKATDWCALEPERAARLVVDRGAKPAYETALQTLREVPYNKWREYDAADAVRFWALRLHEAKMIKSSPQKILAQGTDWRFLTELKKELKG
jgi:NitT/TauT family transport system substrate-binding protein